MSASKKTATWPVELLGARSGVAAEEGWVRGIQKVDRAPSGMPLSSGARWGLSAGNWLLDEYLSLVG